MAAAVAAGEHPADVARRFKVTPQQVRLCCQEHGVPLKGRTARVKLGQPSGPLRVLAAILRSEDGDTLTSLAAGLGVSKQYVWAVTRECWRLRIPTGRWKPPKRPATGPAVVGQYPVSPQAPGPPLDPGQKAA